MTVRTPYRNSRRIISDSSDSEVEEIKKTPIKKEQILPSTPPTTTAGPSIPRLNFAKVPLTPRRDTNFLPTPLKKIDLSAVKVKTPGKKLKGLQFIQTPLKAEKLNNVNLPQISWNDEEASFEVDRESDKVDEDIAESLNLGALKLSDEVPSQGNDIDVFCREDNSAEEDDVDGILQFSPESTSFASEQCDSSSISPIKPISITSSPIQDETSARASTPIIVESDSDEASIIWNPTPRRTPGRRKVVVVSDSDSDCCPHSNRSSPSSPCRRPMLRPPPTVEFDSGPSVIKEKHTKRKPAVLRFIEDQAFDRAEDEDAEYDEEDTMGSLRDFIVDDDYESDSGSGSESGVNESDGDDCNSDHYQRSGEEDEDSDGIEILSSPPHMKPGKPTNIRRIINDDEDNGDDGILYYSPPKKLHKIDLPRLDELIIASSSSSDEKINTNNKPTKKKTVTKQSKSYQKGSDKSDFSNKAWNEERQRIANSIFKDLDQRVFESKLGIKGIGAKVIWNNRLLTTAGVARSKRVTRDGQSKKEHWIELSEKVLTGEKQIINTVAHEMCHLATWVISNEYRNPHGRIFKSWGRKVMNARKDIEVTTTHAYTIEYKYEWRCSTAYCGKIYKRHSKSIDTTKHACGSCKGKLVPLFETKQKNASAFQVYLKTNMKYAKSSMPGTSHGEVMRALSKRWNEFGENHDHESFWKSAAIAAR